MQTEIVRLVKQLEEAREDNKELYHYNDIFKAESEE